MSGFKFRGIASYQRDRKGYVNVNRETYFIINIEKDMKKRPK